MKSVITIDGPSGSGKGTAARILADKLGYTYLDTGALYRAVAWKVNRESIDPDSDEAIQKILENIDIKFMNGSITVDNTDITHKIRTAEIGELSSVLSAKQNVREALFNLQRKICLKGNVVIEGRDTGTVIFPESENKFYLDADIKERSRRRFEELKAKDPLITFESTLADISKRDERDSSRKNSPLKKTDDMFYIDSTKLSIKEVVEKIIKNLKA